MSLSNLLRNPTGEFEIGRTALALGVLLAVTSPIGFQAWDMARGAHFDVTAWCVAYPGGLTVLVSGVVLAIGNKDRQVATAKQTLASIPTSNS